MTRAIDGSKYRSVELLFFVTNYLGNLRYVVVEVACTEDDEYVEVAGLHEVYYILLVYHALLHVWRKTVVDEL